MTTKLNEYLPKAVCCKVTAVIWETLASSTFKKCRCVGESFPQITAKEDIVFFVKITWVISRFSEVLRVDEMSQNVFIHAMNCLGVYLIDGQEQVLFEFSFPKKITITGEMLMFRSLDAATIFK
jgi:hypothetical protein